MVTSVLDSDCTLLTNALVAVASMRGGGAGGAKWYSRKDAHFDTLVIDYDKVLGHFDVPDVRQQLSNLEVFQKMYLALHRRSGQSDTLEKYIVWQTT